MKYTMLVYEKINYDSKCICTYHIYILGRAALAI